MNAGSSQLLLNPAADFTKTKTAEANLHFLMTKVYNMRDFVIYFLINKYLNHSMILNPFHKGHRGTRTLHRFRVHYSYAGC